MSQKEFQRVKVIENAAGGRLSVAHCGVRVRAPDSELVDKRLSCYARRCVGRSLLPAARGVCDHAASRVNDEDVTEGWKRGAKTPSPAAVP